MINSINFQIIEILGASWRTFPAPEKPHVSIYLSVLFFHPIAIPTWFILTAEEFVPADYSLFINCGGGSVNYGGYTYEEDFNKEGQSVFASVEKRWAYSSTGIFTADENRGYLESNLSGLNVSGEDIYKTARLSPQSLRYFGLCMRQGSYNVKLHFAEIMFTNDQTFSSLGKRIFDVSIQVNKKWILNVLYFLKISSAFQKKNNVKILINLAKF